MTVLGIIPVRLDSTRLPRKALLKIQGIPAIVHTYMRAKEAKLLSTVVVATDSDEIIDTCDKYGVDTVKTGVHANGTNRIYEVIKGRPPCDIVVNIQGDEVLVSPDHIDAIVRAAIQDNNGVTIGVTDLKETDNPNRIKAIMDKYMSIKHMSRVDMPMAMRSVFIIAFQRIYIDIFNYLPQSDLCRAENNEFMKLLYNAIDIKGVYIKNAHSSLDTREDFLILSELMQKDELFKSYAGLSRV